MLTGAIDKRVFVDPAHAGGIRTERGLGRFRELPCHLAQVLKHPRARPVQIGVVLENDVDVGVAEKRVAAYCDGFGYREHRGAQRIGHLILNNLRRLAMIGGLDDDLHIGQVRQRINRRLSHGVDAPPDQKHRGQQHQEAVADRPLYECRDHPWWPS